MAPTMAHLAGSKVAAANRRVIIPLQWSVFACNPQVEVSKRTTRQGTFPRHGLCRRAAEFTLAVIVWSLKELRE